MGNFTDLQPKDGQAIVTCGHYETEKFHWFKFLDPVKVTKPDRSHFQTSWLLCCNSCYMKDGFNPQKIKIRDDKIWHGDDPIITKNLQ